jgi:hypothetical protein
MASVEQLVSEQGNILAQAGQTRAPEVANIFISFLFITLSLLGFIWQFGWHRLEDNFDCLPWLPLEGAKLGLPCPFTGTFTLTLWLSVNLQEYEVNLCMSFPQLQSVFCNA